MPDEQRETLTKLSGSESESRGLGGESNTGGESEIRRTGARELTGNGGEGGAPYDACPLKALWACGIKGARKAFRSCSGILKALRQCGLGASESSKNESAQEAGGGGVREVGLSIMAP